MQGEQVLSMVCSVNKESLFVILMEDAALVKSCRVLDSLTNNMSDCIITNIAEEISDNELTLSPTQTAESGRIA
jgi:hypothetical protein